MQCDKQLNSKVLVLNKLYMALHVITAKRAFILLCKERAEVISVDNGQFNSYNLETWGDISELKFGHSKSEEDHQCIKTFSFIIEIPKVIRLLVYDKYPKMNVKFNRKNIFIRDKNICQYCGKNFPSPELSLEHVIPKSRGGSNGWTNIVSACNKCNKRKSHKTPKEAGLRLIKEPIAPKYNPVFNIQLVPENYNAWKYFIDKSYLSNFIDE